MIPFSGIMSSMGIGKNLFLSAFYIN